MLELKNVEVMYMKSILVLRGVSIQVKKGEIVALLGANGAGKSTTLKAISGLLRTEEGEVTDGTILFDGKRIDKTSPEDIAHMGISQVMEGRRILQHLTVEENLLVGAYCRHAKANVKADLEIVYSYFPRLKELRRRTAGYLSGGEQQMLAIGRAMMASPRLMLLDEVSLGLSPLLVQEIFEILKDINSEHKISMLLVEQNARVALDVAERAYVMENGRIVLEGSADELKQNEDVREFYLGLSDLGSRKSYREVKHYRRRKRWLS
ncbi:MAG TPA: ABC transporter ATP-binding protein [Deltaproteobacteria bacterium]|nr:ABC transporter ATP-binding protein [Deltaproteobacteria bacterium]